MSESLNGKVVIVTGASSGIGAATARLLHEAGAHPVLAARRADRLEALSKELAGALAVPTDVTVPDQVQALVQATIDRFGRVDSLVNNAGAGTFSSINGTTPEAFLDLLNLNVVSVVTTFRRCCRTCGRPGTAALSTSARAPPECRWRATRSTRPPRRR